MPSSKQPISFTREELELVTFDDAAVEAADDVLQSARRAVELGVFTPEEAAKHWNLSAEELAEIQKPASKATMPSSALKAIDVELSAIKALRTTDPKRYWSNAMQEREDELIKQRETADLSLPQDVVDEWRQTGGVEYDLGVARKTAEAALNALDEDEQAELAHSFDNDLPMSARSVIYRFILLPPSSSWRTARGTTEEGAALIAEWGSKAARNLGIARGRIKTMLGAAKSGADKQAAMAWLDGLPWAQFRAVTNALCP